jgi:hypothetical protein
MKRLGVPPVFNLIQYYGQKMQEPNFGMVSTFVTSIPRLMKTVASCSEFKRNMLARVYARTHAHAHTRHEDFVSLFSSLQGKTGKEQVYDKKCNVLFSVG